MSVSTCFRKFTNTNFRRCFSALPTSCKMAMTERQTVDHRSKRNLMTTKDEKSELMNLWPEVVGDVVESNRCFNVPYFTDYVAKVLEYNVPNGKKFRAMTFMDTYKMLTPSCNLKHENLRRARIVGWCIELSHSFYMLEDDIMNQAKFRRGQECWYLKNNIGLDAINDGQMIEKSLFQLLKMHFRTEPYYVEMMEEFSESLNMSITAQCLELLLSKKPLNLDLLTMEKCVTIAKHKTAYYSYVLPFKLVMLMNKMEYTEENKKAENIMEDIGIYFQIQDDFLDYHEKTMTTGKNGRDIEEGKCTWPIVVALEHATTEQHGILEECYGVDDPVKKEKVLKVYEELQLPKIYSAYEEKQYKYIKKCINSLPPNLPHGLFLGLLNQIHHRKA